MNESAATEPKLNDEVLDAAAAWHVNLSEPNADTAAFDAWLAADPCHALAFERTADVLSVFDSRKLQPTLSLLAKGARARQARRTFTLANLGRVAAVLAVVAAGGAASWPLFDGVDVYRTKFGELRTVLLNDGSRVALDSFTTVSVRYTKNSRELQLKRGQARFDVAHDKSRPFTVTAGDRSVLATGTAFNIDMMGPKLLVTLIEGHVKVGAAPPPTLPLAPKRQAQNTTDPIFLEAGQQLVLMKGHPVRVETADLQEATAWQSGQLFFKNEPLAEAVERMNRYSHLKIVVVDPAVGAAPVSGVFRAGDTALFLDAVGAFLPLTVQRVDDETVLLKSRPS